MLRQLTFSTVPFGTTPPVTGFVATFYCAAHHHLRRHARRPKHRSHGEGAFAWVLSQRDGVARRGGKGQAFDTCVGPIMQLAPHRPRAMVARGAIFEVRRRWHGDLRRLSARPSSMALRSSAQRGVAPAYGSPPSPPPSDKIPRLTPQVHTPSSPPLYFGGVRATLDSSARPSCRALRSSALRGVAPAYGSPLPTPVSDQAP